MARTKNKFDVIPSSGNVFADLGLPKADEKQTKVRLAVAINRTIQLPPRWFFCRTPHEFPDRTRSRRRDHRPQKARLPPPRQNPRLRRLAGCLTTKAILPSISATISIFSFHLFPRFPFPNSHQAGRIGGVMGWPFGRASLSFSNFKCSTSNFRFRLSNF